MSCVVPLLVPRLCNHHCSSQQRSYSHRVHCQNLRDYVVYIQFTSNLTCSLVHIYRQTYCYCLLRVWHVSSYSMRPLLPTISLWPSLSTLSCSLWRGQGSTWVTRATWEKRYRTLCLHDIVCVYESDHVNWGCFVSQPANVKPACECKTSLQK